MTYDDINVYLVPALRALYNTAYIADAIKLEKELHRTEWNNYYTGLGLEEPISKEYKQELQALAGPHAKTILEVIKIKRGLPRNSTD